MCFDRARITAQRRQPGIIAKAHTVLTTWCSAMHKPEGSVRITSTAAIIQQPHTPDQYIRRMRSKLLALSFPCVAAS
jgi:hypothetical protein